MPSVRNSRLPNIQRVPTLNSRPTSRPPSRPPSSHRQNHEEGVWMVIEKGKAVVDQALNSIPSISASKDDQNVVSKDSNQLTHLEGNVISSKSDSQVALNAVPPPPLTSCPQVEELDHQATSGVSKPVTLSSERLHGQALNRQGTMLTINNKFAALVAGPNDADEAVRSDAISAFNEAKEVNLDPNQQVIPGQNSNLRVNATSGMKHSLTS